MPSLDRECAEAAMVEEGAMAASRARAEGGALSPFEELTGLTSTSSNSEASSGALLQRKPLPQQYLDSQNFLPIDDHHDPAWTPQQRQKAWLYQEDELARYLARAKLTINAQLTKVIGTYQRWLDAKDAGNVRSASRTLYRDPALLEVQKLQQEEAQRTSASKAAQKRLKQSTLQGT